MILKSDIQEMVLRNVDRVGFKVEDREKLADIVSGSLFDLFSSHLFIHELSVELAEDLKRSNAASGGW